MSSVTPIFRHGDRTGETRRPPGAVPDDAFRERCQTCGDCAAVCPLSAIGSDDDGYPRLMDGARCHHCGLCADVCTRGAIAFTDRTRIGLELVLAMERKLDLS